MSKVIPSQLTSNDSTVKGTLGQIYVKNDSTYRYFRVKDAAVAASKVVEYSTTTNAVTMDRAGGSSLGRFVAGVAVSTVSAGNYGWIQTSGTASALVPAAGVIAAGDLIAPHATGDGAIVKATTSTIKYVFAVACGADTATTSGAGVATVRFLRI